MEKLYYGKQLISIDTQFRKFDSMRITNLSINKDNQNTGYKFFYSAQKSKNSQNTDRKHRKSFC